MYGNVHETISASTQKKNLSSVPRLFLPERKNSAIAQKCYVWLGLLILAKIYFLMFSPFAFLWLHFPLSPFIASSLCVPEHTEVVFKKNAGGAFSHSCELLSFTQEQREMCLIEFRLF